jgi:hypothetical protein
MMSADGTYFAIDFVGDAYGRVYQASLGSYNQVGIVDLGKKYFRYGTAELINETILDPNFPQPSLAISVYNLNSPPATSDQ